MIYIPPQKKNSIIPDLNDLPTTMSWPRNRRLAMNVLIVSGSWMIVAAGIAVVVFILLPDISHMTVLVLLGIVTLGAFLAGLSALRQYASQDEVTIDTQGIKTTTYGWYAVTRSAFSWSDVNSVDQHACPDNYQLVTVSFPGHDNIPLALSQNKPLVTQIHSRLEAMLKLDTRQG